MGRGMGLPQAGGCSGTVLVLLPSPQPWLSWDEGVGRFCAMPWCGLLCFTWWCQQAEVFQGILLMLQILTGLNAVELISISQAIIHLSRG